MAQNKNDWIVSDEEKEQEAEERARQLTRKTGELHLPEEVKPLFRGSKSACIRWRSQHRTGTIGHIIWEETGQGDLFEKSSELAS